MALSQMKQLLPAAVLFGFVLNCGNASAWDNSETSGKEKPRQGPKKANLEEAKEDPKKESRDSSVDSLEVEKSIDTAMVMINSGVAHEAGYHLTQALTRVTTIGQRSMTILKDNGLL